MVNFQTIEDAHDKRLSEELKRHERLQIEMTSSKKSFDQSLEEQKKACESTIVDIQQTANAEVKQLTSQLHKLQEEVKESDKIFKEILNQQEEEYEMELLKLMSNSKIKIHQERAQTQEMKSAVTTLKTKKTRLQRQNDEMRSKAYFSEDTLKVESATRRKLQVSDPLAEDFKYHSAYIDDSLILRFHVHILTFLFFSSYLIYFKE